MGHRPAEDDDTIVREKELWKLLLPLRTTEGFLLIIPLFFSLKPGWTSFVGMNNSGKSLIFRFFYELRDLFSDFYINPISLTGVMRPFVLHSNTITKDINEIFNYYNNNDIIIEINLKYSETLEFDNIDYLKIVIKRVEKNFYLQEFGKNINQKFTPDSSVGISGFNNDDICTFSYKNKIFGRIDHMLYAFTALNLFYPRSGLASDFHPPVTLPSKTKPSRELALEGE